MRRQLGMLVAATASIALPTVAQASPDALFWRALCSAGAVRACGEVVIRTVRVNRDNNYVQVLIRNLQGFDPRDNTGGSIFNAFQLFLPQSPPEPNLDSSVPTLGTKGRVRGAPSVYVDGIQSSGGFVFQYLDAIDGGFPGDGIRGCEVGPTRPPFNGTPVTTLSTCRSAGYPGWVTLATRPTDLVPYRWNTAGASFTAFGVTRSGASFTLEFPAQTPALVAQALAAPALVTPEPATWVLLGSGLALLALLALRRRG